VSVPRGYASARLDAMGATRCARERRHATERKPLRDKDFWRNHSEKISVDKDLSHTRAWPPEATVNRLVAGSNPARGAILLRATGIEQVPMSFELSFGRSPR
jgi:hypothetical protein